MTYNWQLAAWPNFEYDPTPLRAGLHAFAEHSGRISGLLEGLPASLGEETVLDFMIAEAVKSSAIEGEALDYSDVMSSIRNNLGLNPTPEPVKSRLAAGAGQLMVAVRSSFSDALTEDILFDWHKMLLGGTARLRVGSWREGGDPMQVISGRIDKPTVHFEAPPSAALPQEMAAFIDWFNATAPGGHASILESPIRAGIAHLYFESIHPFEDGNGRIGRAIAEKALAQGLGAPAVLSLSRTIEANRANYYEGLKQAQRTLKITEWLDYFIGVVLTAQLDAEAQVRFVLKKAKFFQRFESELNERQLKVIRRVLDAGPGGFEGGINSRKFMALTKCSKATATRDLQQMAAAGVISPVGLGRATRYEINL